MFLFLLERLRKFYTCSYGNNPTYEWEITSVVLPRFVKLTFFYEGDSFLFRVEAMQEHVILIYLNTSSQIESVAIRIWEKKPVLPCYCSVPEAGGFSSILAICQWYGQAGKQTHNLSHWKWILYQGVIKSTSIIQSGHAVIQYLVQVLSPIFIVNISTFHDGLPTY